MLFSGTPYVAIAEHVLKLVNQNIQAPAVPWLAHVSTDLR